MTRGFFLVISALIVALILFAVYQYVIPQAKIADKNTIQQSELEKNCLDSGGQVVTQTCCQSSGDFPNSCLIGACGCSPSYSHQIKICDCGQGKCFDGYECNNF
jgi:hypothetical protein